MDEAVGTRQDFNESAEIDNLPHSPFVDLSDLGLGGDSLYHLDRFSRRRLIAGGNGHGSVIFHIHLYARGFDDATNNLTARSDDFTDFIGPDLKGNNSRRMACDRCPMRSHRFRHDAENMQPALPRLI